MDTRWLSIPPSVRSALVDWPFRGERQRRETYALQELAPLSAPWLPWTGDSMQPTALVALLKDIVFNDRRTIVELGGGISTIYIGRLLAQRGRGQLYTVEEDESWAATFLRPHIERERLGERVSVVVAPPAACSLGSGDAPWYSSDALEPLGRDGIDLLIVDGPIAARYPTIRYPALPYFFDVLADDGLVALDDISRKGESEIIRRWERDFPISFDVRLLSRIAFAHGRTDSPGRRVDAGATETEAEKT